MSGPIRSTVLDSGFGGPEDMGTRKGLRRNYSASSRGVVYEGWHKSFHGNSLRASNVVQGAVPGRFLSKNSDLLLVETAEEKTEREFRLQ